MEDLIACLYSVAEYHGDYSALAAAMPENQSRSIPAGRLPDLPHRHSRESTASLEDGNDRTKNAGLQLTFTHSPKAGPGFFIGTDPNSCDIVVPALPRVSRRHCYITFDAQRSLIVRDCSTYGTIVTYDGKGEEIRRHFTWIIGGDRLLVGTEEVIIQLHPLLRFQVLASKPSFPQTYLRNVDTFLQDMAASTVLPFGTLGIQTNTSTPAAPSVKHSPSQPPILLKVRTLGRGAFSTVSSVWDVSTGFEYASKKFHHVKSPAWRREAELMRRMSHEHLVQLAFELEQPTPQLILEYLPLGNLEQQNSIQCLSEDEMISTLTQGLSALTYLHGQTPPIVHRDIKPENILVQSRDPLHIKVGDFGLSKASEDLQTLCGTDTYLAPEVAKYYGSKSLSAAKYTSAVDVWSIGVVICKYVYDLPRPGSGAGLSWCERIVRKLNDYESDGLLDLLSNMVVMEPRQRYAAADCLYHASRLNRSSHSSTPTTESHAHLQQQASRTTSASPTVRVSRSARAHVHSSHSKRERSPGEIFDESHRTTRPFSRVLSVSRSSVFTLLNDIQGGDRDHSNPDSGTSAWIEVLCKHLQRLDVAQLKVRIEHTTERVVVTALSRGHEFRIANFTSSERTNSIVDLAQCLAEILRLMSRDTTDSHELVTDQLYSPDNQRVNDTQPLNVRATQSINAGVRSRTGSVTKARENSYLEEAHEDYFESLRDSSQGESTGSDSTYPVTFPSGLLDELNASGCAPPMAH